MNTTWIILGIGGALLVYIIILYNGLIGRRNQVKNAWSQIDVQLKRRHDLIPNLVSSVKGYMKHERETLQNVVEARAKAASAGTPAEAIPAEGILTGALGKLFALMENYPDLKANQSVQQLMEELSATENKTAFARQFYNDSVMSLNNALHMFPSNIVAALFGFKEDPYFEAPEEEKAAPKVDLT